MNDQEMLYVMEAVPKISESISNISLAAGTILFKENGQDPDDVTTAYFTAAIQVVMQYCMEFPEHARWFYESIQKVVERVADEHEELGKPGEEGTLHSLIAKSIVERIVEKYPARSSQ